MSATPISTGVPSLNSLATVGTAKSTLDKDGFLKMLVAQMTNQDPTAPMSAAEQTQQMASFTLVEQMENLTAIQTAVAASVYTDHVLGLLGKTVTYLDENDEPQTGVVDGVSTVGGDPMLTVNGVEGISPSVITKVA